MNFTVSDRALSATIVRTRDRPLPMADRLLGIRRPVLAERGGGFFGGMEDVRERFVADLLLTLRDGTNPLFQRLEQVHQSVDHLAVGSTRLALAGNRKPTHDVLIHEQRDLGPPELLLVTLGRLTPRSVITFLQGGHIDVQLDLRQLQLPGKLDQRLPKQIPLARALQSKRRLLGTHFSHRA